VNQACTPVAVLLAGWAMGVEKADVRVLFNVSFIVIGVIIASIGEIKFVLIGVLFQLGGIVFEAMRLVMVQRLLSSAEYKMDPLVSLYYFAPICAIMNFCVALVFEIPRISMAEIQFVGPWILLSNAMVAFALNVSVVFLVSDINSTAIPTLNHSDRSNFRPSDDPLRCLKRYPPRRSLHRHLGHPHLRPTILWLQHRARWSRFLQAWRRSNQSTILGNGPHLGGVPRKSPSPYKIDHLGRCCPCAVCVIGRPCASGRLWFHILDFGGQEWG